MLGLFLFIFAILFCIGLHEFGHFITAKKFGIKVEQFFIGFGPKLWSVRKGETEYGVKALPLGGFVRIAGMNPFEEIPEEDRDRVFKAKKPWQRAIVLGAGSFTHFVLALLIIAGILWISGAPQFEPSTTVRNVSAGTPAEAAGIKKGDTLLRIDGVDVGGDWDKTADLIRANPGESVPVVIQREGETISLTVKLAPQNEKGEKVGFLGVAPNIQQSEPLRYSLGGALVESAKEVGTGAKRSLFAFKDIFSPATFGRLFSQVTSEQERTIDDPTSVVGLGRLATGFAASRDFASFFALIAAFNIFIGVANLLPLPPLDGGHLAVLAYEKVSRRDVDMRRLIPVTAAVISIFGSLFLLLLWLDIFNPIPPIG